MLGASSAINWQLVAPVAFGLVMFGLAFNGLMERMGERKAGYTSLFVVAGVVVTLAGVAIVDWQAALLCASGFVASGTPMVIGDVARAIQARDQALAQMRREVLSDEQA